MHSWVAILPLVALLAPFQSPADSFRKHYETAEAAHRAGNMAVAEKEYTAIVVEAAHELGRVYTAEKNYPAAVAALETAASYDTDSPDLLVDLAIAYFHVDQYQKAIEPLTRAISRAPRNAAAHHMMGKTRFMLGEFPKAVAELRTALRLAPGDYDVTYTLGLAYLKQQRFADARALYNRLVARLGDRPQLRVLVGRAYRETGFLGEAIEEFKRAAALDPHFPRVHYYLGLTYLLKDGAARLDDAAAEFRVELAEHPDEYFANYYLGILSNIGRKWPDAVALLEKASRIQPDNPDPYFHLGEAYQGAGMHDRAIEALEKTIALNPDLAHNDYQVATAHYRLGQSLLKVGRADEGEKELEIAADLKSKSLQHDETKTEAYLTKASLQAKTDSVASGEGIVAETAAPDSQTAEALRSSAGYYAKVIAAAYNEMGLLFAERGDFRAAAERFGLAAKWNPEQEGLNFNLGLAKFKAERYAEAVAPLEREVAAHPGNVAAKRLLGMSYFMTADYAKATPVLSDLVAVRPDDATLYYPLALALAKEGRTDESNRIVERMVAAGDRSPQVHILLGQAYSEQGDTSKALGELREALALDAKTPLAHFYTGMIYLKTGKLVEAREEFERELALNPADLEARFHLGYAMLANQETARGIETMREVLRARPDFADARYELGKALLQQGDVRGAVENLEAAAKLDPDKAHVHYQLGRAYIAAGREADGERELETSRTLKERARNETNQ